MRSTPDPPRCLTCDVPLSQHWQCARCRCFGHKDVQARYGARGGYIAGICRDCDTALARRGLRYCEGCQAVKPVSGGFPTPPKRRCTDCERIGRKRRYIENNYAERAAGRREKNRERIREQDRKYREKNRERIRAAKRAARKADPEKHRARWRAYAATRREQRRAVNRAWAARNREHLRAYKRQQDMKRKLAILAQWRQS